MPIDKNTSLPITQLNNLNINYVDKNSTFTVPRVTTVERNALVNVITDVNPLGTVKDSTIVYNVDNGVEAFQGKTKAGWINFGAGAPVANAVTYDNTGVAANINVLPVFADDTGLKIQGSVVKIADVGDVKGPVAAVNTHIATFNGNTGKLIADSGVIITRVQGLFSKENALVNQISEIGVLQFGDNTEVSGSGHIFIDSLSAVTFQENQSNACTVITSGIPTGSSSPSATLEINTDEGAFLHARLTTKQMNGLVNPVAGMEIYNTDTKELMLYTNGVWSAIGGGAGSGNVVGPNGAISGDIPIFADSTGLLLKDSGVSIDSSGDISSPGTVAAIAFDLDSADGANNAIGLVAPNLTKSYNLIFPSAAPTAAGQALITGTPGATNTTLSWGSGGSGGIVGPSSTIVGAIASWGDLQGKVLSTNNVTIARYGTSGNVLTNLTDINISSEAGNALNVRAGGGLRAIDGSTGTGIQLTPGLTSASIKFIKYPSNAGDCYIIRGDDSQRKADTYFALPYNNPNKGNILTAVGDTNLSTQWSVPATLSTLLNSGINITTDDQGNNTIDLSFATIVPDINGDILNINKRTNIDSTTPYMLGSEHGFLSNSSSGINEAGTRTNVSLTMTGSLVTSQVNTISSKHIKSILSTDKKNIATEVLDLFKKINLVKYEYKDQIKHGNGVHYGVVAEEIKRDFPHLVQDMLEVVPNIINIGNVEYINSKTIKVTFSKNVYWTDEVARGKSITVFSKFNTQIKNLTIESIHGTNELILSSIQDLPKGLNEVFVYGTEENCPSVAKERLFEMSLVVIQNLMNQIETLTIRIDNLELNLGKTK